MFKMYSQGNHGVKLNTITYIQMYLSAPVIQSDYISDPEWEDRLHERRETSCYVFVMEYDNITPTLQIFPRTGHFLLQEGVIRTDDIILWLIFVWDEQLVQLWPLP